MSVLLPAKSPSVNPDPPVPPLLSPPPRLLPRARRDEISRIMIETTGLAEPAPILATPMTDPVVASAYPLDVVGTVIAAAGGETPPAVAP